MGTNRLGDVNFNYNYDTAKGAAKHFGMKTPDELGFKPGSTEEKETKELSRKEQRRANKLSRKIERLQRKVDRARNDRRADRLESRLDKFEDRYESITGSEYEYLD